MRGKYYLLYFYLPGVMIPLIPKHWPLSIPYPRKDGWFWLIGEKVMFFRNIEWDD